MPRRNRKRGGKPASQLPYVVKTSDIMGRYIVAANDLSEGCLIVQESPIVVGPCHESSVCLACYAPVHIPISPRCSGCGWPVCQGCVGAHTEFGHSSRECFALSSSKQSPRTIQDVIMYDAIVPLRCLMLKGSEPQKWTELCKMESHNQLRKNLPEYWNRNQKRVVDPLRNQWGFSQFSEEEIHTVCGYLEVNSFSVGLEGRSARGLFPSAYLLSHDCIPNTTHMDDETYTMSIRSSVPIAKGQPITLAYTSTLQGTMKRRVHLKESKFFDCCCARCVDPTEYGTMLSAIKCADCSSGSLLSTQPLDAKAPWKCNSCTASITAETVLDIVNRIEDELESIKERGVQELENFLVKHSKSLHPNHYLLVSAEYSLSQLYGKVAGYIIHEMNETSLQRKVDICQHIMSIFDVVEPGISRIRGVTMYEMHAPIMVLATKRLNRKSIGQKELKTALKKVAFLLKEAARILANEPASSEEAGIALAAKQALDSCSNWAL